jgi:probable rRNA maturation factor
VTKPLAVDIQNLTSKIPVSPAAIRRWARAAFGKRAADAILVIRFVGAAEGRRLNLLWRGRDYATNVLSFPPLIVPRSSSVPRLTRLAKEPRLVGDLVLCAPVVAREAREQGKLLAHHYAHLIVHGCLHLLGYDHELDADAKRMERQERRLLATFGIDDPYRVTESLPTRLVKK